jgi:hypothetical protein
MCINPYLWPAWSTLYFENSKGSELFTSKNRRLDLADTLMLNHSKGERSVYFGILTKSKSWSAWTPERVERIEARIHYDFEFEGYKLTIARCEEPSEHLPCTRPFRWKLNIKVGVADVGDDEVGL